MLCALTSVVVHSFVTDGSLFDYCDLVGFLCVCVFHLMLAGRQLFGVLRWFQLFCFFHSEPFHVRLFVFALLALVSGYQYISQFLVSCCVLAVHQLHPWRYELDFFRISYPVDTTKKSALKQTPFGILP